MLSISLGGYWLIASAAEGENSSCDPKQSGFCYGPLVSQKTEIIEDITMPKLAVPTWLNRAEQPITRTVNYTVATKGDITVSLAEFKAQVAETLNNPLGWSRLGVRFEEVKQNGQFTVWLSQDKEVPSFAPGGCDAIVSCTVGDNVIINQTRWLNGSDAWNAAGGSLRNYRHTVLNHETGHWLGHGHAYCPSPGADAPLMQQQTIDMHGCQPNPWPLIKELYAPKLGIYS